MAGLAKCRAGWSLRFRDTPLPQLLFMSYWIKFCFYLPFTFAICFHISSIFVLTSSGSYRVFPEIKLDYVSCFFHVLAVLFARRMSENSWIRKSMDLWDALLWECARCTMWCLQIVCATSNFTAQIDEDCLSSSISAVKLANICMHIKLVIRAMVAVVKVIYYFILLQCRVAQGKILV